MKAMRENLKKNITSEFFKNDVDIITFDRSRSESNQSISRKILHYEIFTSNIVIQWAPFDWIEFPIDLDQCCVTVKCKRKNKNKDMFSVYYNQKS